MRVLLYHWADIADPQGRGGGVTVYQRNLVAGLLARGDVQVETLCGGLHYDLIGRTPRVVRLGDAPCPRHALVNSGLLAPSHAQFAGGEQTRHAATEDAFGAFLARSGPWDVIHFNTLEGVPAQVLALAAAQARVVVSMHNYYPFCPQVNLWHAERAHCDDFIGGARCATCLPVTPNPTVTRGLYRLSKALHPLGIGPGTRVFDRVIWRGLRGVLHAVRRLRRRADAPPPASATRGAPFAARRQAMVDLLNTHSDAVLCVSDRVRTLALGFGLDPAITHTQYIGTPQASAWQQTAPALRFPRQPGHLHLAYLGYMRRDKGFYFLLQALLALPPDTARRLTLTIAAQRGDADAMALLARAQAYLGRVIHMDGYRHDDLDRILSAVDLGVVPVLWEDNMPQVALEMHARHIPLLTSDKGGAQELALSRQFVFRAGDTRQFAARLNALLDGQVDPAPLWPTAQAPVDMETHIDSLLAVYRGEA